MIALNRNKLLKHSIMVLIKMSRLNLVLALLFVMLGCELYQYATFLDPSAKSVELNRSLVISTIIVGLLMHSKTARYLGAIIIGLASGYTLWAMYDGFSIQKFNDYISTGKYSATPLWVYAIAISAVTGFILSLILLLSKKLTSELAESSYLGNLIKRQNSRFVNSRFSRPIKYGLIAIVAWLLFWATYNDINRLISKWTN